MTTEKEESMYIPVICSWCNSFIKMKEWPYKEGSLPPIPTHGICVHCYRVLQKIEKNRSKEN